MDKQFIIDAIRRTAEKNGGKPLGTSRFRQETGIRVADWSGKYWARWSDAVREAGYSPNTLQESIEEDSLLLNLIALTRELGHFPVRTELKLKRGQDKSFPSHNTFNRFGSKGAMVAKVLAYCRQQGGFDDILAICEQALPEQQADVDTHIEEPQTFGSVYMVRSGKYYKIGMTNAFGRREYELGIQLPDPVRTVHVIQTDDPSGIEAYWHNRFASKRKNGEWFDLDAADVAAFKRRKFM